MTTRTGIRILIVDDNMLIRAATKMVLGTCKSFEVIGEAADGGEGVKMALELEPDIVLMDINMRPIDGIEATRLILRAQPYRLVIGFSALPHKHEEQSMLQAGAVGVIHKSASKEYICERILQLYRERIRQL